MSKIINHKLEGIPFDTLREAINWQINARFDYNPQASVNISPITFSNTDLYNASDAVRQYQIDFPTEGPSYSFDISDGTDLINFLFYLDYNDYQEVSASETKVALMKEDSVDSLLDIKGADITLELLKDKGFFTDSDIVFHPYVVENRKTLLEKIVILQELFMTIKALADEVFKFINNAADLISAGSPIAIINLGIGVVQIIAITNQLIDTITEIFEAFFPGIRFHTSFKLKNFITKACSYLGYEVDFGTWDEDIVIIPPKGDEEGLLIPEFPSLGLDDVELNNFSYNLADAFRDAIKFCNGELAIIDNTVHCRPKKDPYWLSLGSYVLPNILIEQSPFVDNGFSSLNRDELRAATILRYEKDDSDYWTLRKFADDFNGDRLAVATVFPEITVNPKRNNVKGIRNVDFGYSLVTRKGSIDELLDQYTKVQDAFNSGAEKFNLDLELNDIIKSALEAVVDIPVLGNISNFITGREGALRVENFFFDKPKVSILEVVNGKERIPEDFNEKIGAKAIYNKYYTYDSLVPGVRNPSDLADTAGKRYFNNVKVDFNLQDLIKILKFGYFNTEDGRRGRFFGDFNYNVDGGFAVVNFWIQEAWLNNVKEEVK